MTVEIGKVVEAAFVADLGNAFVVFHEQPAGVANTYLGNVVCKRFSCVMFEIP